MYYLVLLVYPTIYKESRTCMHLIKIHCSPPLCLVQKREGKMKETEERIRKGRKDVKNGMIYLS